MIILYTVYIYFYMCRIFRSIYGYINTVTQDPMAAVGGLLFGGPQLLSGPNRGTKTLAGSTTCGLVARRDDGCWEPSEMESS